MKDQKIVCEWYSGRHHFGKGARKLDENSQFNVYSTRVTYIGLAAAIAVFEGRIRLDDRLSGYFPELDSKVLGETTIRHLISRCTGLLFKDGKVTRQFDAGTDIEGKQPDLLADIVEKAYGRNIADILTDKILKPMN
ncbi:serine hydrolase domain-containing protein [Peribacillus sp. SCS-37]|uniref:serine hydrolase domain-containing protein n=1 Tax=Paraperibacillus esterisolvens TaxID=3115296 RepID=UPI003905FCDD